MESKNEQNANVNCCIFDLPIDEGSDNYSKFYKELYWKFRRWEVRLPIVSSDPLNAFDRLFLELAHSSSDKTLSNEIPQYLGISGELFEKVCFTLQSNGYFDKNNRLTNKGQNVVEGKDSFLEELAIAKSEKKIIFQDAFSGRVIPYIGDGNETWKNIEHKGKTQDPWMPCENNKCNPPENRAIIDAVGYALTEKYFCAEGEQRIGIDDKEWLSQAEKRVHISDIGYEGNYCFIKFLLYIDPNRIINNSSADSWRILTPFGSKADRIIEESLRAIPENNPKREELRVICKSLEANLKGKVIFDNKHNLSIFKDYPEIGKYEALKQNIEEVETQIEILKNGFSVTSFRTSIANAIGQMTRVYRGSISLGRRQTITDWLDNLSPQLFSIDGQLADRLKKYAEDYGQYYEGFEKTYSIENPNITRYNLRKAEDDLADEKNSKKLRMAYLLLVAGHCSYKPWKRAMEEYTQETKRSLYQDIAWIEHMRNKESAHDSVICFGEVMPGEIERGKKVLYTLIRAFFEEDKS